MNISIKRAYDKPERSDGTRILVDRLWPRGVTKEKASIDMWLKDAAPSSDLRTWFHVDPEERWAEFKRRYRSELDNHHATIKENMSHIKGPITLVTAAKDVDHSHVPIIKEFLQSL